MVKDEGGEWRVKEPREAQGDAALALLDELVVEAFISFPLTRHEK